MNPSPSTSPFPWTNADTAPHKTHTVMVENIIKPLVGEDLSSC
jgi:hypothetical protein